MDSTCFICYEDGGTLIDLHWRLGTLCNPKHLCHAGCFQSWRRASKEPVIKCPYCMNLMSDTLIFHLENEQRWPIVDAIRKNNFERFKNLLSNFKKISVDSRHILLTEATIAGESSFLDYIEEKYSLPYFDLIPFLATALSMKSSELCRWYWKAYDKQKPYPRAWKRRYDFGCQMFVAAIIAKKMWLAGWLRFRMALRLRSSQYLPERSIVYVMKFGRSRFYLKTVRKLGGDFVMEKEYLEHIVPQIVTDEVGWKLAYWSKNHHLPRSPEVGPAALVSAVAAANWKACEFFFYTAMPYNYGEMRKNLFRTTDVEHLFGFRGKRWGLKIFESLCLYKLVDLRDLRTNKLRLCAMSYQSLNDELTKFFLSVLRECLTAKEIQAIHA